MDGSETETLSDDTVDERIVALARLDSIAYDQQRAAAAKKMGVRVSTLDKLVAQQRASRAKNRIDSMEKPDLRQLYWTGPRTVLASNISPAALFRYIDTARA